MLNSSRRISNKNNSTQAQATQHINGFANLNKIKFITQIDINKNTNGEEHNKIKSAVMPNHHDYTQLINFHATPIAPETTYAPQPRAPAPNYTPPTPQPQTSTQYQNTPAQQGQPAQTPTKAGFSSRPNWAE